jgi:hypothetical protein
MNRLVSASRARKRRFNGPSEPDANSKIVGSLSMLLGEADKSKLPVEDHQSLTAPLPSAAINPSVEQSGLLCTHCESIYNPMLCREYLETLDSPGRRLEDIRCPLCRFLYDANCVAGTWSSPRHLWVTSTTKILLNSVPEVNNTMAWMLFDGETGKHHYYGVLIHGVSSMHAPRIISPILTDYSIIRGWLHECRCCYVESDSVMRIVPGLKVIDCNSKEVVQAPSGCSYVALSYVWGQPPPSQHGNFDRPFPATIDDSLTVCRNLGFEYLWVDRYVCAVRIARWGVQS